ncbi:unnamed protein product [Orchesella dallaii]|uniref:glutathione transferase n=1 Tax=Orchesella dallaii TaxID=48710 RepID=A0ABP1Q5U2_9HEXA
MAADTPTNTPIDSSPVILELVDFDMRGLSEPIRYLLQYLKLDFKDTRIRFKGAGADFAENWLEQKYNHSLDFPNLPFFSDEEVKITDSLAIIRHIARKHNLAGETSKDIATIEMVEGAVNDLRWGFFVLVSAPNYSSIVEDYKLTIPARLGELNNFIKSNQYVAGSKITYVDFLVFETLDWFRELSPESFEDSAVENLKAYMSRIEAIAEIRDYRNSDEFKNRPLFSPVAHFGYSKDASFTPIIFSYRNFVAKYPIDVDEYFYSN